MKRLIGVKELRALMEEPKPIHEKVDAINTLAKKWMESEMQIVIKHYIK
mgnify:FL=1|tara:strand:- start:333 stop:479 length:147 start_codon:yes stop_codon:yes gene_type:complete